jgi:chorismate synthase
MHTIKILTAGESHGRALVGTMEGVPSGFSLSSEDIDKDLRRRQGGYGRGGRMQIELDHAEILSGVRWGRTLGSPISLLIENRDWNNWQKGMSVEEKDQGSIEPVVRPRPGHADLAGALKYATGDVRDILERSSARETAMRVALGSIAKRMLSEFNIFIGSYVVQIGSQKSEAEGRKLKEKHLLDLFCRAEKSPVRCPDDDASKGMVDLIDRSAKDGNSLGGIFEVFAVGVPVGLGSHVQWDRKLDGRLAQAVMSIQAIKGVEIGRGFEAATLGGSEIMDEIFFSSLKLKDKGQPSGFYRKTNNAGGIEGGISNGMPVVLRAAMKPIPTLRKPLRSIDMKTRKAVSAAYERSDVCAVPAAAVVGEAMMALVLADAMFEKFGGDSREEILGNYRNYLSSLRLL